MTRLGEFLARKAMNQAAVARRSGLHKTRLNDLCNKDSTVLKADELYLIAMAMEVDPCVLLEYVYEDVSIKPPADPGE